jgi:hypothetical protein
MGRVNSLKKLNHNGSEADMEELAKINPSSNGTERHG